MGVVTALATGLALLAALLYALASVTQQRSDRAGPAGRRAAADPRAVLPPAVVARRRLLVAAVLGVTVLREQVRAGGAEWLLIGLAVLVMVVATAALARASVRGSPEVAGSRSLSPGSR